MLGESCPNLLLNCHLGGVEEQTSGGRGFNLRDTLHRSYLFQLANSLEGFALSFVTEDVGHCLDVCL